MDWKRICDALGLNGTHWQWRIIRWKNRWADWKEQALGEKQVVAHRHRFCPECGAIVEQGDKVCAQCQTTISKRKQRSVAPAARFTLPTDPFVSQLLIAFNLAIMGLLILRYGSAILFDQPYEIMSIMGGLVPLAWHDGEYWRLITYGYLHYGLFHILFNMFALYQLGPLLEKEIGPARFFSVYTLTLMAGGAADLVLRPHLPVPIAGASGALCGLIGFGAAYCHFSGGYLRDQYRNHFITWAIYVFVFGFVIGADNIAHGGGLVGGALLGWGVERERLYKDELTVYWGWLAMALALITFSAYVWMVVAKGGQRLGFML